MAMPRFGLVTLNHSSLHGLPRQWEAHADAAATAGFDALAPGIFWLRTLEEEGAFLERLASRMRDRGLAGMEISGIAIGSAEGTERELAKNLHYARAPIGRRSRRSRSIGSRMSNSRMGWPMARGIPWKRR